MKLKTVLKLGVVALIFFILVRANAINSINSAVNPEHLTRTVFTVEEGQSASEIGSNLKEAGLIKSAYGFSMYLEKNNLDSQLQAGEFTLQPSMTGIEIVNILTGQSTGEIGFTIPEGWTIKDIDTALAEKGLITAGEFENCTKTCDFSTYTFLPESGSLEGYLFPDTFFLNQTTFDTYSFVKKLLDNFDVKITDQMMTDIEAQGRTLEQEIIVASIIEKEVRTDEDRGLVSGIVWKRLDNGWQLGMCSTINYLTGEAEITAEDLEIDSPYNTRMYTGLPPTAISNPGLKSIEAAIYPETSEYWYFLNATDTGETIYATTNEEQEANKAKHLK
ncbi:MAG: endolytic transglycosylase MltG [Candidatus Gracilibacteria bacterium]|jgi:UPF0755 protein